MPPVETQKVGSAPAEDPQKRHRVLRIFAWLGVVLLALPFLFIGVIYVLGVLYPDNGPIDDSDLALSVTHIADADNAYFDLQNATSTDVFAWAATKAYFIDPAWSDPTQIRSDTALTTHFGDIRRLGKQLHDQALLDITNGNTSQAVRSALDLVATGQAMQNTPSQLLQWLVGANLVNDGLQVLQQGMSTSTLTQADRSLIAAKLTPPKIDSLENAMRYEYLQMRSLFRELSYQKTAESLGGPAAQVIIFDKTFLYYHPNESLEYLANDRRKDIADLSITCEKELPLREMEKKTPPVWLLPFSSNAIGKIIYDGTVVQLSSGPRNIFCNQLKTINLILVEVGTTTTASAKK
jgi:hypothetical protein